ncbi:hypothetical protein LTR50_001835 [Elasticomyces elasticus]|nr:hypothetical protein LTR50_001835 [Elasticomyces elasticus]
MKESYQLQFGDNMVDKRISEDSLPSFKRSAQVFMGKAQSVSEKLMLCFARGLGFPDDYFIRAHDVSRPVAQSVITVPVQDGYYRAGAHADWDFLTLLFQCPARVGRKVVTSFGMGDTWTKIDFAPGDIVCNTGDLLMSWSDDRFRSAFHRVKAPADPEADYYGPRYSIAFFNQPCTDCAIKGPLKKYPMVTGEEFAREAMERNLAALKAKKEQLAAASAVATAMSTDGLQAGPVAVEASA